MPSVVLRLLIFVVASSTLAPLALVAQGVRDRDLLVVVFVPSVLVGVATACFAMRSPAGRRPWAVDTRRMP